MHGQLNVKCAVEHVLKKPYEYKIAENINQWTIILMWGLKTEYQMLLLLKTLEVFTF